MNFMKTDIFGIKEYANGSNKEFVIFASFCMAKQVSERMSSTYTHLLTGQTCINFPLSACQGPGHVRRAGAESSGYLDL